MNKMKVSKNGNLILIVILFITLSSNAQHVSGTLGKGINIAPQDSTFGLNFSPRFQTTYAGIFDLDSDNYGDVFLIRRARLKFSGFIYNPNIRFKLELGQSNRDTGGGNAAQFNNTANSLLDAVLKYKFGKGWDFWVGQTKLPGNRQRVVSSQKMQLVDRSLVNARYNLDRDLGIQLYHKNKLGKGVLNKVVAISMGEGRGIVTPNIGGYSYTVHIDYLPMGEFTNKGDFIEADLAREPTGKLAIGLTYNFNDEAGRSRGQLGDFMLDEFGTQYTSDLSAIFIDLMYKHNGFSLLTEYTIKESAATKSGNGIIISTPSGDLKFATGSGFMAQTGYLFKSNYEISGRFTTITSDDLVFSSVTNEQEYMIGFSKYIFNNSLKIQTDFSYRDREFKSNFLQFRLQMEMTL